MAAPWWIVVIIMFAAMLREAVAGKFGQYSIFTPDLSKERSTVLKAKSAEGYVEEVNAGTLRESDTHIFSIEVPEAISDKVYKEIRRNEIDALNNRLQKSDTVVKEKNSKCVLGKDALVATFKNKWNPFFGWTTYSLVRHDGDSVGERSDGDDGNELVIKACSLGNRDAQCVILFKALLKEDRTVQCIIECDTVHMSKKERKNLLSTMREIWKDRVLNALLLASSRVNQKKSYASESKETMKKLKARKLDKVLNPEKYKSQSPTVRRTGGSNGGRYDPSQGARERASAKRRTQVVRRGG